MLVLFAFNSEWGDQLFALLFICYTYGMFFDILLYCSIHSGFGLSSRWWLAVWPYSWGSSSSDYYAPSR